MVLVGVRRRRGRRGNGGEERRRREGKDSKLRLVKVVPWIP